MSFVERIYIKFKYYANVWVNYARVGMETSDLGRLTALLVLLDTEDSHHHQIVKENIINQILQLSMLDRCKIEAEGTEYEELRLFIQLNDIHRT